MPLAPGSFNTAAGGGSGNQGGTTGATTNAIVKATAANTLGDSDLLAPGSAMLQLGGATSSYPALIRSSANIQVVKADSSGYTDIYAAQLVGTSQVYSDAIGGLVSNAGASGVKGIQLASNGQYCWGSSTTPLSGFGDTGLGRSAAGVVKVTDGDTGQGALLAKRVITAKTADYTVTAAETGTVFTNTGASGTVVFTLPASPANGLTYEFHITAAQSVDIKTGTAVLIYANAAATTATTGKLTKNTVGTCIQLVYNGVAWMGVGQSGTWTVS